MNAYEQKYVIKVVKVIKNGNTMAVKMAILHGLKV